MDLTNITISQMIDEVRQEADRRQRVYPSDVAAGRMGPDTANESIQIMRAIQHKLEAIRLQEAGQRELF